VFQGGGSFLCLVQVQCNCRVMNQQTITHLYRIITVHVLHCFLVILIQNAILYTALSSVESFLCLTLHGIKRNLFILVIQYFFPSWKLVNLVYG